MDEIACIREPQGQTRLQGNRFILRLSWKYPIDMVLAAVCVEKHSGTTRLVYHGDQGARMAAPWVKLTRYNSGRERVKKRYEKIIVADAGKHQAIHLFAWDRVAVEQGAESSFAADPESYELSIVDQTNAVTRIVGRQHQGMNCVSLGSLLSHGQLCRTDTAGKLCRPENKVEELVEMVC